MKRSASTILAAAFLLFSGASQATRIPGTQTYYSFQTDPITDVNKSNIALYEVNDVLGDTALIFRCADRDVPSRWLYLRSKHDIVNPYATQSDGLPDVVMRLGTDAPVVVSPSGLTSVLNQDGTPDASSLGIYGSYFTQLVNGLNSGKRLVIRINRESGGQPLTYTFSSEGFSSAWNAIRGCSQTSSSSVNAPRPVAPATTSGAPKFTEWYFTTCRDTSSGTRRTGLVAGRAHLCDLVIETIPNGAYPVSAEFNYELEYIEGGTTRKFKLDSIDTWPPLGSGPVTTFNQSGNRYVFTLPLNVRARADRRYNKINVTATIRFSNGSSKKVYEPLPVSAY